MSGETPPIDPIEQMRGAYAEATERWTKAMQEVVGSEGFAAVTERFSAAAGQQEAVRAQAVERWSKAMEEIVGSEGFAAASGQLLALYAQQQQSFRAASRVVAESMHMPTTEDLAEVARLVINVERKVEELSDHGGDVMTRLTAIEARLVEATATADAIPAGLRSIEEHLAGTATALGALSERLTSAEEALRELAQRPTAEGAAQASTGQPGDEPAPTRAVRRAPAAKASSTAAEGTGQTSPSAAPKKPATKPPTVKKRAAAKGTSARRRTPPADG